VESRCQREEERGADERAADRTSHEITTSPSNSIVGLDGS
jgi:hypothetical protein